MKDAKALFLIQQDVAENLFSMNKWSYCIEKKEWEILREELENSAKVIVVKLQTLRRQFQNL
jgi:hypothetical protein